MPLILQVNSPDKLQELMKNAFSLWDDIDAPPKPNKFSTHYNIGSLHTKKTMHPQISRDIAWLSLVF